MHISAKQKLNYTAVLRRKQKIKNKDKNKKTNKQKDIVTQLVVKVEMYNYYKMNVYIIKDAWSDFSVWKFLFK